MKKVVLLLLLSLLLIGGSMIINTYLEKEKSGALWHREQVSVVVSSPEVIPFLLGYETTLANYLWIKTMLYFGDQYSNDRDFEWLKAMIDAVTMLNPPFYPAYEFGGMMVPEVSGDYNYSRILLDRGCSRIGDRREFAMFLNAWVNYSELQDYHRAGDLMELAAHWYRAPQFWAPFAATIRNATGDAESSLLFMEELFLTSDAETVRKAILEKILKLQGKEEGARTLMITLYPKANDEGKYLIEAMLSELYNTDKEN